MDSVVLMLSVGGTLTAATAYAMTTNQPSHRRASTSGRRAPKVVAPI
jgi:hypothetical protein